MRGKGWEKGSAGSWDGCWERGELKEGSRECRLFTGGDTIFLSGYFFIIEKFPII